MPSPTIRIAAALIGILVTGSALADELPGFTFAEACRIDDTSAVIRIVYQGGECETTADLEPRVELDGTGGMVIIASRLTAEICTMQIIPNHVQKTVGIAPDTVELDVTLLNPQLEPLGRETVAIGKDGVDCAAKGDGP